MLALSWGRFDTFKCCWWFHSGPCWCVSARGKGRGCVSLFLSTHTHTHTHTVALLCEWLWGPLEWGGVWRSIFDRIAQMWLTRGVPESHSAGPRAHLTHAIKYHSVFQWCLFARILWSSLDRSFSLLILANHFYLFLLGVLHFKVFILFHG